MLVNKLPYTRMGVRGLFLLFTWVLAWGAQAQKAFPGWSAPKVIPTTSTLATYPDIAVSGDTLHVIFRATFTNIGESQGPSDQEVILEAIQQIDLLLRAGNKSAWEQAGGKDRIRKQRAELNKKLQEVQQKGGAAGQQFVSPLRTAIYYTRSEDRGRTWWPKPVAITSGDSFLGQTCLELNSEGLHVVYTAATGDNQLHIFSIHSADGGKTWTRPAKVSDSIFRKFNPNVSPIPGNGLIASWWELETTDVEEKTRPDLEAMNQLIQDPILNIKRTTHVRSTLHYARYLSGSWMGDQILETVNSPLSCLSMSTGPRDEVYIYWVDETGLQCRMSRNGGVGWETNIDFAQVMRPTDYHTFLFANKDFQFVKGRLEKGKSGTLMIRKNLLGGEWRNIIDEQAQYSYPQLAYTRDELQVVWGTTDLTGNRILYFREDNKPPTSEMVYPPNGDFAKYQLAFIWSATDDIATQLTYRYVIMERNDPKVRPEPHNWPLYDAVNHYAVNAPKDGYYTLYVQATDFSGNEEKKPTAVDFQTFFVPPGLKTEIDTLPPIEISTRNIEIKWKVEDNSRTNAQPLIAYRLDGNPVSDFAPRTSIKIAGLTSGWHQVQIYAMDENGNVTTFGDTATVRVTIELKVEWRQIPLQPRERVGGKVHIYVKDERVPLSWVVTENTQDQGINYLSSIRVYHNGVERPWTLPQPALSTDILGKDGGDVEEGEFLVQVVAQDEYGNPSKNYIETTFTVDHSPPEVLIASPIFDPETKVPAFMASAKDNFSDPANLEYQFRIIEATEGEWTAWSKNAAYAAAGRPVKFFSWGYIVEARARDVAGNVSMVPPQIYTIWDYIAPWQNPSTQPGRFYLTWYARSRWIIYTLAAILSLLALGVSFLVITTSLERARARRKLAARKAAALKTPTEAAQAPSAPGREDELFALPDSTPQAQPAAGADLFGAATVPATAFGGGAKAASPFDDPFSTSVTQVFDDPFAGPPPPPKPAAPPAPVKAAPAYDEEPPPLEIGLGDDSETKLELFADVTPPEAPSSAPQRDWSPDRKVELTDRDLFDPL